MRAFALLCVSVACGPAPGDVAASPPVVASPVPAQQPSPEAAPVVEAAPRPAEPAQARRCLPVVAAECGCVYSCGLGVEETPGRWSVAHAHWGALPVQARVDRWCVGGRCTEAFFGEIVCGGICAPRPAEPHCQLVGDRCEIVVPAPEKPATPLPAAATWPFVAWDRAEAFTYNHVPYGPGIPLRVYDEANGWSRKIVERRALTADQAGRAVKWVAATGGEVEVSKCAFPRHAVVLYAGEVPVGTVNVCFECGDILVWPAFDRAAAPKQGGGAKPMAAYKKVFPQWERLFRDELGFSLTPPPRP